MKWINTCIKVLAIFGLLVVAACGTSENFNQEDEHLTLRQHLKRISGVYVKGTEENTRITIRAEGSLYGNRGKQPLFVVDGSRMGRNFYDVASKLEPEEIESVEVLTASGANMYGNEGGQGVIEIETTRDED